MWLQRNGWDVKHEQMAPKGTVSSLFCVDDDDYLGGRYGGRFSDWTFKAIDLLVRNPVTAIPALRHWDTNKFWPWAHRHVAFRDEEEFWVEWNAMILNNLPIRDVVHIEDFPKLAGVSAPYRTDMQWDDLRLETRTLAKELGY